ncbi:MAG TPA: CHAD domain-containing protein [Stellaceae bacterium]|nr:CHAD domain-containing protein [Stellaceae bacterium]
MTVVTSRPEAQALTTDLTLGDGLQEMLGGALSALGRHASPAKLPPAEAVHRFRVGLRRLRSILSAFGDVFPEPERHALSDRLHAVAQRYGPVREWDVFLAGIVAPLRAAMPADDGLRALERLARQARRGALPPGDTLKSSLAAVGAVIADAADWLRRPAPEFSGRWDMALHDYAAQLLTKRHRRLRKRLKDADLADRAAFHQLRIRVKKLRYPAELLRSLFDEDASAAYLKKLVALQDLMGRVNDARVGEALLRDLTAPEAASRIAAGWIAREIELCCERFPKTARRFRRAEPFWEA